MYHIARTSNQGAWLENQHNWHFFQGTLGQLCQNIYITKSLDKKAFKISQYCYQIFILTNNHCGAGYLSKDNEFDK